MSTLWMRAGPNGLNWLMGSVEFIMPPVDFLGHIIACIDRGDNGAYGVWPSGVGVGQSIQRVFMRRPQQLQASDTASFASAGRKGYSQGPQAESTGP